MNKASYEELHSLLNAENHDEARARINQNLQEVEGLEPGERFAAQAELYGFLCDVGSESHNEADLERSIAFMEANAANHLLLIQKSSFHYNLANAKSSLAKIQLAKVRGVRSPYETQSALHDAITNYWIAHNSVLSDEKLRNEIAVNLANTLNHAGRWIEALQFLDGVLRRSPAFPQALVSRADNLHALPFITSGGLSTSLLAQEFNGYRAALATGNVIASVAERCKAHMNHTLRTIASHGFALPDIETEIAETTAEYQGHSAFRKFSIDHFLTLNEHAVYCPCNAARWDDLQAGSSHLGLKGAVVPKMELLLNRLKSEFALARWMYFKATVDNVGCTLDSEFSDLMEGESLGPWTELLRTSFRQCYGILDKLAMGVCDLYQINPKQNVYFETFWDQKEVKEKVAAVRNIHLNALFSIASDLNKGKGELRHFKSWRNALEHRLMVLKDQDTAALDTLGLLDQDSVLVVDVEEFKQKALHLLQLTRAAILSLTFCVRLETMSSDAETGRGAFTVDFRE